MTVHRFADEEATEEMDRGGNLGYTRENISGNSLAAPVLNENQSQVAGVNGDSLNSSIGNTVGRSHGSLNVDCIALTDKFRNSNDAVKVSGSLEIKDKGLPSDCDAEVNSFRHFKATVGENGVSHLSKLCQVANDESEASNQYAVDPTNRSSHETIMSCPTASVTEFSTNEFQEDSSTVDIIRSPDTIDPTDDLCSLDAVNCLNNATGSESMDTSCVADNQSVETRLGNEIIPAGRFSLSRIENTVQLMLKDNPHVKITVNVLALKDFGNELKNFHEKCKKVTSKSIRLIHPVRLQTNTYVFEALRREVDMCSISQFSHFHIKDRMEMKAKELRELLAEVFAMISRFPCPKREESYSYNNWEEEPSWGRAYECPVISEPIHRLSTRYVNRSGRNERNIHSARSRLGNSFGRQYGRRTGPNDYPWDQWSRMTYRQTPPFNRENRYQNSMSSMTNHISARQTRTNHRQSELSASTVLPGPGSPPDESLHYRSSPESHRVPVSESIPTNTQDQTHGLDEEGQRPREWYENGSQNMRSEASEIRRSESGHRNGSTQSGVLERNTGSHTLNVDAQQVVESNGSVDHRGCLQVQHRVSDQSNGLRAQTNLVEHTALHNARELRTVQSSGFSNEDQGATWIMQSSGREFVPAQASNCVRYKPHPVNHSASGQMVDLTSNSNVPLHNPFMYQPRVSTVPRETARIMPMHEVMPSPQLLNQQWSQPLYQTGYLPNQPPYHQHQGAANTAHIPYYHEPQVVYPAPPNSVFNSAPQQYANYNFVNSNTRVAVPEHSRGWSDSSAGETGQNQRYLSTNSSTQTNNE